MAGVVCREIGCLETSDDRKRSAGNLRFRGNVFLRPLSLHQAIDGEPKIKHLAGPAGDGGRGRDADVSRGLGGDRRALFQLAAAGVGVPERFGIDMHHDLLTVGP